MGREKTQENKSIAGKERASVIYLFPYDCTSLNIPQTTQCDLIPTGRICIKEFR